MNHTIMPGKLQLTRDDTCRWNEGVTQVVLYDLMKQINK